MDTDSVPATNQAGELYAQGAEAMREAVIAWLGTHSTAFKGYWHCDPQDALDAMKTLPYIALATQPATSQEGEADRYRDALRVICEEELTRTEMMQIAEFAISKNPEETWMNDSRSLNAGLPATSQEAPCVDPRGAQCGVCGDWFQHTSARYCATCIRSFKVPDHALTPVHP